MTKKNTIYIAAAAMLLTACSSDEPGMLSHPAPASFSAQIGKTVSRATSSEWSAGDAIGISGVSGTKTYSNVNYATPSGDGNFAPADNGIFYQTTEPVTFTAYYPYSAELDADGIISASTADQSKQASFDFLWAQAQGSYADPAVRFDFGHKMSLITLTFINGNDVNLDDLTYIVDGLSADGTFHTATGEAIALGNTATSMTAPLTSDRKSSLIVFPQAVESVTLNAYVDGQQYACNLNLTELKSGHQYSFNLTVKKSALTVTGCVITNWTNSGSFGGNASMPMTLGEKDLAKAAIGDFYMRDGSIVDKSAVLTGEQIEGCIGIVFSTDPNRVGEEAKAALAAKGLTPHGLVMALTNAADGVMWSTEQIDEPGLPNIYTLKEQYDDIEGFNETKWIVDNHSEELSDKYPAFYHASVYGSSPETSGYAAPATSTGWFIPSGGNLIDMVRYLGKCESIYENTQTGYASLGWGGVAVSIMNNINQSMAQIRNSQKLNDIGFWTSTESSNTLAKFIYLHNDSVLSLGGASKNDQSNSVRCILAF